MNSSKEDTGPRWAPSNFLALPEEQCNFDDARVVILPVPYDSTTSFKTGARDGPRAIIEASYNLEDYDPELDEDVALVGIYTAPMLEPHMGGPSHMIERVHQAVYSFLQQGKLVAAIGGEHSISLGAVTAAKAHYPDLSVLYLDAHADMRDEYMGTRWGHASVARRISEVCPFVQMGVRSFSLEEKEFIKEQRINTLFWPSQESQRPQLPSSSSAAVPQETISSGQGIACGGQSRAQEIIGLLSQEVYVSVDLDVLDPSIMSAVGTPEPGGMDWYQVTSLLRSVAQERRIVGFDVTELSPDLGPSACAFTAAKLAYKLVAYGTLLPPGKVSPETMGRSVEPGSIADATSTRRD